MGESEGQVSIGRWQGQGRLGTECDASLECEHWAGRLRSLLGGRSRGSRAMRKQNMQEVSKEIALGLWSIGYGEFSF